MEVKFKCIKCGNDLYYINQYRDEEEQKLVTEIICSKCKVKVYVIKAGFI